MALHPQTNAYVGSGTPVVSKHPIRVPVPAQKQTPPKKLPRANPGQGYIGSGLATALTRARTHLNPPSALPVHAPPPRSSTPTMTGTGHTALTPHPLSTNPTPGAASSLGTLAGALAKLRPHPAVVPAPPVGTHPGGGPTPPVGIPWAVQPPQHDTVLAGTNGVVGGARNYATIQPTGVPGTATPADRAAAVAADNPPAKRDFRDMLQESIDAAYGGVDKAEQSAQASARAFNKSLLASNLGPLVGNKAYASLLGSVLKEQAKSAQSFADSRRKIAEGIPDHYNKLQAQTAQQEADAAKLDFDYYKTNMGHDEWKSEFGLKVDKQGFDQRLDTAKFGLDTAKFGFTVASKKAELTQRSQGLLLAKKTALQIALMHARTAAEANAIRKQLALLSSNTQVAIANQRSTDKHFQAALDARYKNAVLTQRETASARSFAATMASHGLTPGGQPFQAAIDSYLRMHPPKTAKGKGVKAFTPTQISNFQSKAADAADAAYSGLPAEFKTIKDTNAAGGVRKVQTHAAVQPVSYQEALRRMVQHGIPAEIAVSRLNSVYPANERGKLPPARQAQKNFGTRQAQTPGLFFNPFSPTGTTPGAPPFLGG